jgi:hypothetical protein
MGHEGRAITAADLAGVSVGREDQGVPCQRRTLDEVGARHQVLNIESTHGPNALYISVDVRHLGARRSSDLCVRILREGSRQGARLRGGPSPVSVNAR